MPIDDIDLIVICCDGIFDVMSNSEVQELIKDTVDYHKALRNDGDSEDLLLERCLDECARNVLRKAIIMKSDDNVTVIIVALKNVLEL